MNLKDSMELFSNGLQHQHLFYIFPKIKSISNEDILQLSEMHFKDPLDDHILLLSYYLFVLTIQFKQDFGQGELLF